MSTQTTERRRLMREANDAWHEADGLSDPRNKSQQAMLTCLARIISILDSPAAEQPGERTDGESLLIDLALDICKQRDRATQRAEQAAAQLATLRAAVGKLPRKMVLAGVAADSRFMFPETWFEHDWLDAIHAAAAPGAKNPVAEELAELRTKVELLTAERDQIDAEFLASDPAGPCYKWQENVRQAKSERDAALARAATGDKWREAAKELQWCAIAIRDHIEKVYSRDWCDSILARLNPAIVVVEQLLASEGGGT